MSKAVRSHSLITDDGQIDEVLDLLSFWSVLVQDIKPKNDNMIVNFYCPETVWKRMMQDLYDMKVLEV